MLFVKNWFGYILSNGKYEGLNILVIFLVFTGNDIKIKLEIFWGSIPFFHTDNVTVIKNLNFFVIG